MVSVDSALKPTLCNEIEHFTSSLKFDQIKDLFALSTFMVD